MNMPQTANHTLVMDGRWELHDLYSFPHLYSEVYSFLYALHDADASKRASFKDAFQRYPWRGGYSAVNFYNDLYADIPVNDRPHIVSIKYSSPGAIELALILAIASQIERIVTTVLKGWDKADEIYTQIHRRAVKRKLLVLDVKAKAQQLEHADLAFVQQSVRELSESIGLENPDKLQALTEDWLGTLKILLSFYRRLQALRAFYQDGKVRLEMSTPTAPPPARSLPPGSSDAQRPPV